MRTKAEIILDILSYIGDKHPTYECIMSDLKEPGKLYSSREYMEQIDEIIDNLIDDEYIEEDIETHSTHIVDHDNSVYYYSLSDTGKDFLVNLRNIKEST